MDMEMKMEKWRRNQKRREQPVGGDVKGESQRKGASPTSSTPPPRYRKTWTQAPSKTLEMLGGDLGCHPAGPL